MLISSKRPLLKAAFTPTLLVCLLAGCFYGRQHTDILTKHPEYWDGFPPGQVYELVQDAFCLEDSYHFGPFLTDHYYSEKRSHIFKPDEYEEAGVDEDIKIVSSGTRIQCTKLVGRRGGGVSQIDAYGVILDGQYTGTEVDFGNLAETGRRLPEALPYVSTLNPRLDLLKPIQVKSSSQKPPVQSLK
jgi:hypothetical protein